MLLTFTILVTSSGDVFAKNTHNTDDYSLEGNIRNKQAIEIYKKKVNAKSKKQIGSNFNIKSYSLKNKVYLTNDSFQNDTEIDNFNKFEDQVSIFNTGNEENYTNVIYSPNNDIYGIMEVSKDKDYIFIELDQKPYKVYLENDDIILKDSDGKITPLQYTVEDSGVIDKGEASPLALIPNDLPASDGYTAYRGPYYKTNKLIFKVIKIIATAGEGAAIYLENKVLGVISWAIIKASDFAIGDSLIKTLYIKYFQANKLNDLTYVKQKNVYYSDSNHRKYIKTLYTYFYSQRP